jgi:hypothetical protein
VLLLLGLFSQPSIAQSRQQLSQQQAEKNVAQMSEEQMREYLPQAKERLKEAQSALKTGNYSKYYSGDDALAQGVAKAAAESLYYYLTAAINAIEKRLHKIDSQKPKPQTEQQQQEETDQQQQEIPDQNVEEELQKKFDKKMGELQPFFNELHTDVDAHSDATRKENVAANLVRGRINTNGFTSVTTDMLDKQQLTRSNSRPNSRPNTRPNISDKIQKQKSEEPKKEEPVETPKEASNEYDEILRLINELDK